MFIQISVMVYLVLLIPIFEAAAYFKYSKQIQAGVFSNRAFYAVSILELWLPVIVLGALAVSGTLSFQDLGITKPIFNYHNTGTALLIPLIILASLPILWLLLSAYQIVNIYTNSSFKKAYYEAVEKKLKKDDSLTIKLAILPKNTIDRICWIFVSITAGITEEILFRGFMVYFLHIIFPELPLWTILLIQTIPFGLMHMYQGIQGVFITAAVGLLMAVYTYVFGSIVIAVIIHIFTDLASILIEKEQTQSLLEKEN